MTEVPDRKFPCHFQRHEYRRRQGGFHLVEWMVVVVVFGILVSTWLERLEYAEKINMEATAINIRSGLRWRVAELMMADRMGETGSLLNENPIHWLRMPPPNYLGELSNPRQENVSSGNWYFDSHSKELIYIPYHHRFFKVEPEGTRAVRYKVSAARRTQTKGEGRFPVVEGVRLVLVNAYTWQQ